MAIVHPWMPQYRVEFFERLRSDLDSKGVELDVAYGRPPSYAHGRGDDRSLDWAHPLPERQFAMAGRALTLRQLWKPALDSDLLILEDGLRNLDTWAYVAARKVRRRQTAFWGHGRTTDKAVTRAEASAKDALVKRGDWWFAYSHGSADHLIGLGLPAERVTVLNNTFDTDALKEATESVDRESVERLAARLGLTRGHTALYLGGLSAPKNLDLLIESARLIAAEDPAFRAVIAGDGPDRQRLERLAGESAPVVFAGPVFDPRAKAELAAACDLIALPGLVGLTAVDSFVLELPAVAVEPWNHCPEFEYLRPGVNSVVARPDPASYSRALLDLIGDPKLLDRLKRACREDAGRYTLDSMVDRFSSGVIAALGSE